MTAQEIIARALRALGVIAAGETLTAQQATDGLESLNDLFAALRGEGIALPEYTAAALNTELSIDRADKDTFALLLADMISGEYGAALSPRDGERMLQGKSLLRTRYFAMGTAAFPDLPVSGECWHDCEGEI